MIKEFLRKFGYVKLEEKQQKLSVFKSPGDIIVFTFENKEQIIIQTDNKEMIEILIDLELEINNISIDTVIEILKGLSLAATISRII